MYMTGVNMLKLFACKTKHRIYQPECLFAIIQLIVDQVFI